MWGPVERVILADETVKISQLLERLGFSLHRSPPCQVRCPVHKMGQETRPSARVYDDDSFVWCYSCWRQYRGTEIVAETKGCSRVEAADWILGEWPVDSGRADALLRDREIKKKAYILEDSYDKILEDGLIRFRRRVSLEDYRQWAIKVTRIKETLPRLPEIEREIALCRFLREMENQLRKVLLMD